MEHELQEVLGVAGNYSVTQAFLDPVNQAG